MSALSSIERIHHEIREITSSSVESESSPSPQFTLDSSPAESVDSSLGYDKWFDPPKVECNSSGELNIEELFAQLDLFNFFESELCLEDRARVVISLVPTFLNTPYAFRPHSGTKPEDIPNSFNATIALVFDVLTELQSQPGRYQTYVQAIQESPFQVNDILRVVALGTYSSPLHYLALPFPVLYPTSTTDIFSFLTTNFDKIGSNQTNLCNIEFDTDNFQAFEPLSSLTSTIEAALTVSPNYSEFSFYPASLDNTAVPTPDFNPTQIDSSISQFLQELVPLPNVSSIEDELLTIDSTSCQSENIDCGPTMTVAQTNDPISPKSLKKLKRVNKQKKPTKAMDLSRRIIKCPYENCPHRYTHTSGVKYHLEKCEFRPGVVPVVKPYPCLVSSCRKSYKSTSGRKYHLMKFHSDFLKDSNMLLSDGGFDDEDQPSKEALESVMWVDNLSPDSSFSSNQ